MSRSPRFILAAAALAVSAAAASAQSYPLTNGPNGTATNTPDSARGFSGINAVAPEREFLYHPERAGNAAAALGITAAPADGLARADAAPVERSARHRRRKAPVR